MNEFKRSIPTNGPLFKVAFHRERHFGANFTLAAVNRFVERVRKTGGVYSELGSPRRESWMSDQHWQNRVNEIDLFRTCARIVDAEFDGTYLFLTVQAVGNNRELLESGDYTLGYRGFGRLPDISILVTFDLILNSQSPDPVALVKVH